MHPLLLLLVAWLVVNVVLFASVFVAGRHRARRPELRLDDAVQPAQARRRV